MYLLAVQNVANFLYMEINARCSVRNARRGVCSPAINNSSSSFKIGSVVKGPPIDTKSKPMIDELATIYGRPKFRLHLYRIRTARRPFVESRGSACGIQDRCS